MNLSSFGYYYGPMMNGWDGSNGWFGLLWGALMFVVFISVIVLIARAIGRGGYMHDHHMHRDPLDIARERYAKGDITKEQLAEIKKELGSK